MKTRRRARELALQVLYAIEMGNDAGVDAVVEAITATHGFSAASKQYGVALVRAVMGARARIDEAIQKHTANWELRRLASIDRNVLRSAVAELLFFPDTPYRVIIDEAVEIAKIYGTADSGKFVNGVIDSINRELRLCSRCERTTAAASATDNEPAG